MFQAHAQLHFFFTPFSAITTKRKKLSTVSINVGIYAMLYLFQLFLCIIWCCKFIAPLNVKLFIPTSNTTPKESLSLVNIPEFSMTWRQFISHCGNKLTPTKNLTNERTNQSPKCDWFGSFNPFIGSKVLRTSCWIFLGLHLHDKQITENPEKHICEWSPT